MKLTDYELGKKRLPDPEEGLPWQDIGLQSKHPWYVPARERERRVEILRLAVKAVGTQVEVSRRLGVSEQAISIWKHGSRPVPEKHIETLQKIAGGGA